MSYRELQKNEDAALRDRYDPVGTYEHTAVRQLHLAACPGVSFLVTLCTGVAFVIIVCISERADMRLLTKP